ncbi:methylaspartate ammonia-lyase [Natronorubrum tibetense GA33]|uniref:Methylaspartate ammonia-lyase n=2 Tax=Natronorubrum tibetense TaxID=63128 RepID=L9VN33_9EURY|nr:methylaspartate ammonia-lyase [Natronorubrum tibetense GA33]
MGFDEGYMIVENEMRRTIARRERDRQAETDETETDEITADD